MVTLTDLAGAGPVLGRLTFGLERRLILKKVEERWRVSLLRYMYRIALQNVLM